MWKIYVIFLYVTETLALSEKLSLSLSPIFSSIITLYRYIVILQIINTRKESAERVRNLFYPIPYANGEVSIIRLNPSVRGYRTYRPRGYIQRRVRVGTVAAAGTGGGTSTRKANYRIIAFNCDSCYLRNGAARDCRRVPNYWMLTSPPSTPSSGPRCGVALLVIAGTNYAISAAL